MNLCVKPNRNENVDCFSSRESRKVLAHPRCLFIVPDIKPPNPEWLMVTAISDYANWLRSISPMAARVRATELAHPSPCVASVTDTWVRPALLTPSATSHGPPRPKAQGAIIREVDWYVEGERERESTLEGLWLIHWAHHITHVVRKTRLSLESRNRIHTVYNF